MGSIAINLTGQGASGAVYRLRHAIITVEGPASTTWNTEDDPSRTSLSANVEVGDYAALVHDGWHLERVQGSGAVAVSAALVSANPIQFTVAAHQRTDVPLRFDVDGDIVDTSQGYDITIDVNETSCRVETEATDCGAHEFCDVTGGGHHCACVAGYTDAGHGCAWAGAVRDPAVSEPSTWTSVNGALLNPTARGGLDPGEAIFVPSTLCDLPSIQQTFDMPAFARAEPLVLELSYKDVVSFQDFVARVPMGVSWGRGWVPLPPFFDGRFHVTRICLGESAYAPAQTTGRGAPVTLALGPYEEASDCPSTRVTNFAVDHAQVVVANPGECGTSPGAGVNGDAEGTGGWTFSVPPGGSGGFAPDIGANGSHAARVQSPCSNTVFMSHPIDIVANNPALELFVGTTGEPAATIASAQVAGGAFSIPLPPVGQSAVLHMCLPRGLAGQSTDIAFSVLTNPNGFSCAQLPESTIFADDVHVVEDPACQTSDAAGNPGFELPGAMFGAFGGTILDDHALGSAVVIHNNPEIAHSGTGYLAIESYGHCSQATVTLDPIVPRPNATGGPALTFFSNLTDAPDIDTTVGARDAGFLTLPKGGGWVKNTLCLNPVFAGRPQTVGFFQYGGNPSGPVCGTAGYGIQATLIDDVEVTTDPSCPTL